MGGPVVQIAPRFGVMLCERVVVDRCAGLGGDRQAVAGGLPFVVQFVQPVEGVAQNAQLVDPAALHRVLRQADQLGLGGGQQVAGARSDRFERRGGVCVTPARPQAVGAVVAGPAVEVGVLLGVGIPGGEDLVAVAQVVAEVPEGGAVCVVVGGDGESCRFSGVLPDGSKSSSRRSTPASAAEGVRRVLVHVGS